MMCFCYVVRQPLNSIIRSWYKHAAWLTDLMRFSPQVSKYGTNSYVKFSNDKSSSLVPTNAIFNYPV